MFWQSPSDKELRGHGMFDRIDLFFKTPLKWVVLFFVLFALFIYWLLGFMYGDKPENLIGRKQPATSTNTSK